MVLSHSLRPHTRRGAAFTEFAILMPGIVLLIFCLLQYGLLCETAINLDQAAEAAARALLVQEGEHPDPAKAASLVMAQVVRAPLSGKRRDSIMDWVMCVQAARITTHTQSKAQGHRYAATVSHDALITMPLAGAIMAPWSTLAGFPHTRLTSTVELLGGVYNPAPIPSRSPHAPQHSSPQPRHLRRSGNLVRGVPGTRNSSRWRGIRREVNPRNGP